MEEKPPKEAPEVRVLTTGRCASMSGKSKLVYEVGSTPDSEIHVRVLSNTGNGAFSKEWVSLRAIREALAGAPKPGEITSFHLRPLYEGSANSPAFMLAVLRAAALVRPSNTRRRCHQLAEEGAFATAIAAWRQCGSNNGAVGAEKKTGAKMKGASKEAGRKGTGSAVARNSKQKGPVLAAQDGTVVAMEAIPSFIAIDVPAQAAKAVPRNVNKKQPS